MCGIVGRIGGKLLPGMLDSIKHRGPDSTGWYSLTDGTTFGHTRLKIIDLTDAGNQPIHNDRYTLVYNGEIYNYKTISFPHDDLGTYRDPGNDAHTLFKSIQEWGLMPTIKNLNGMFAFAVHDKLENKLHLVVDRFGQKPLFYYHAGQGFMFASTPAALTGAHDTWKLNQSAVDSYFLLGGVMGENSLFDGIKRVLGAYIVTYDIGRDVIIKTRYWEPQAVENVSGIEDLVLDAIQKTKVSDVPINILLSGGIDSTLIASQCEGMAAVHLESPEIEYAKEAARKFRIHLNTVESGDIDVHGVLKDFSRKSGVPAMAAMIPYITCERVKQFGKVAITANGADELFFGYNRIDDGMTVGQIEHIFREFTDLKIITDFYNFDVPFAGRLLELYSYVQFDLNQTLDFSSMAHGVEVRAPFLDHRLVEMALSIPKSGHVSKEYGGKSILKRMLSKMGFSDAFLKRPKVGFSLHREPPELALKQTDAYRWCKERGFIKRADTPQVIYDRNTKYLKASALSFKNWFEVWENKISL